MKQYFSKLHKKWIDLKTTDCEKSLKKFKYKIREKPDENLDKLEVAILNENYGDR